MKLFFIIGCRVIFLSLFLSLPVLRAEKSLSLEGKWRFSRDETKVGLTEKWYERDLKPAGNGPLQISLPGTTDEARAGVLNPKSPSLDGLYRPNMYVGPAWYQRDIDIPEKWKGKHVTLFLERNHWENHVWLDNQDLGAQDSLVGPQIFDLGTDVASGKHRLTICVDNTLKFNLGEFVSINYEGTQTNWNGIVGAIELRASDSVALANVEVYPDIDRKLVKVKARVSNVTGLSVRGDLQLSVANQTGTAQGTPIAIPFTSSTEDSVITAEVPMGDNPKLWDEFSPYLYTLRASLTTRTLGCQSKKNVTFGMRKLAIQGTQFTMNSRPLMLRGTLECAIFPLTGYPPTDVASWRRIFQIEKSYGLNFIRFHSWCPPDAAFAAADLDGIMVQVEGPQANVPVGKEPRRDEFVEHELQRIIHTYGNHPSFCLMTLGNEFGGNAKILTRWVDELLRGDPRHLYSSASSNRDVTANRQWTESEAGRGVQSAGTDNDLQAVADAQDRPLIGHEIGQWTFYPNFDEIKKYTGVVQAKNFELIRDDLQAKGMADEAPQFFQATGKQAVLLYKEEIEVLLRTPNYAGFSLLDLHDYPGQGTALIGLLDPFWDSKGFIPPEEHKRYCGATVPLLRFPKRAYTTDESFVGKVDVAHFGPADLTDVQPEWTIQNELGQVVANGSLAKATLPTGKLTELGDFSAPLSRIKAPVKLTVTVSLKTTGFSNSWNIWVYPPITPITVPDNVTVCSAWDDGTRSALAQGKKVILFPKNLGLGQTLNGAFEPVFWSPIWFHRNPDTMGILCDPKHPLFAHFPTEFYSDWQWWNLIQGSQTMILTDTPATFRPLVQVIDNFSRNDKLGNVFETKVGNGRLLVCTLNLGDGKTPEGAQFFKSLYAYVASDAFAPSQELEGTTLNKILSVAPSAPSTSVPPPSVHTE